MPLGLYIRARLHGPALHPSQWHRRASEMSLTTCRNAPSTPAWGGASARSANYGPLANSCIFISIVELRL